MDNHLLCTCGLLVLMIAYGQSGIVLVTTDAPATIQSSTNVAVTATTQSDTTTTVAAAETTAVTTETTTVTTETTTRPGLGGRFRNFIKNTILGGIRDGIRKLIGSDDPNNDSATATAATETTPVSENTTEITTIASSSTAATQQAAASACPQGQYDSQNNKVVFNMEDKNCEITVYMGKKEKAKRAKGKEDVNIERETAKRFIEKNVSVGPTVGSAVDQCPEVSVTKEGKDGFFVETSECVMYVAKNKGKGKERSDVPIMFTSAVRK